MDPAHHLVLSNELKKLELPLWRIWKADGWSVSPSSERIALFINPRDNVTMCMYDVSEDKTLGLKWLHVAKKYRLGTTACASVHVL